LQERFLPVIERNSRKLIDAFRHTGSTDIVADYATRSAPPRSTASG
jgi:pulcherriminic acid synthase